MRFLSIVCFAPGFFALTLFAAPPILQQDFSKGPEGWTAFGSKSAVETGEGALRLRYTANPETPNITILPASGLALAEANSIRFEIRTDSSFAAALLLSEKKPGGNYSAVVWSNGDMWQPVVLSPADFTLNEGPKDPPDPDGKLDLDRIENIALLDLTQFFSLVPRSADIPLYLEAHTGEHLISIRHFEILRDAQTPATALGIDDFSRPQPGWFTFGGASFEQTRGVMTIRYRQMAADWVLFSRPMPMQDFSGSTHLAMDISSERPAQLILSLRERKGIGYHTDLLVSAGDKPEHREIALDAFMPDSGDEPLNLANLQSIVIVDISGEDASNTLTLRDLKMVKR